VQHISGAAASSPITMPNVETNLQVIAVSGDKTAQPIEIERHP
jgi:hypothetical protein